MKTPLLRAVLALCLCSSVAQLAAGAEYLTAPSNPNASAATHAVYDYLRTRRGQPTNSMIEGQFLGMINQVLYPGKKFYGYFDLTLHEIDGKLPAMAGSRYDGLDKETDVYRLDPDICTRINQKLIDAWVLAQPIIHITASPRNPWNQQLGRSYDTPNTQKIGKLLRAATLTDQEKIVRDRFWADIDTIAGGLQELQAAGIPVLFRPFAEFNTADKYYFNKQSGADFVALWKEVYRYYTDPAPAGKGLNNLLFCWEVWALNRNPASGAGIFNTWYPGDSYVDVVAGAYYFLPSIQYLEADGSFTLAHADAEDKPILDWLTSRNRPFGAAQFGLNQGTNEPGDHDFTRAFMTYAPDLSFAFYWNQYQAVQNQAHKSEFVSDPRVATHDDLPLFGEFPATITLGNLSQTYDGSPRVASVTTSPAGLDSVVTYDGSTTPPTNAGSYDVAAMIDHTYYHGSATGTLVVAKASATVTLANLHHVYDGTPKSATATTNPTGLRRWFAYDGSTTPPTTVGSYSVVCTVNDPNYAGSAAGTLTIVDGTPPALALPADLVLEATSATGAVATFSATANDDVDGNVPVALTPASGSVFPFGVTTVNATASDAAGNTASGSFHVTVQDSLAPVVASATPSVAELWPANHAMVPVSISVDATDAVGVTSRQIVSVTSNEPDNGTGDGDTAGDIEITGPLSANLRAERAGTGTGRIYTFVVEVRDAAGNVTTATAHVSVPRNRSGR